MDLDKLADLVVLTVKSALAPILERVAATEARVTLLGDLRDRVVTVETKAGLMATAEPVVFDAAPLFARISELEQRVLVAETKAAMPVPLLETKDVDLSPVLERVSKMEQQISTMAMDAVKEISAIRERVSVVEVRPLLPGPAGADGKDGTDGANGLNGKDGADGLGFDDVQVEHDGERTFTVKYARGERVKVAGTFTIPSEIYRGVYVEGRTYDRGDCVTWGGSEFHCNESTTSRPEQSKAWTLKVKRGRDGRDGKDAEGALPVVKVGGR